MKPWTLLGQTVTPDGSDMRLTARDDEHLLLVNGKPLMSSRMHGSEEELARVACVHLRRVKQPHVLVGGLGMGFTLRATLDVLQAGATVTLVELVPAVIEWNRGPLALLAGQPLSDHRVRVEVGDVRATIRASPGQFDAILLDVDNGPETFSMRTNRGLYDDPGVAAAYAALRAGGTLAVWAARDDRRYEQRLRSHGFVARVHHVGARGEKGGARHAIFLGLKGDGPPAKAGRRLRSGASSGTSSRVRIRTRRR